MSSDRGEDAQIAGGQTAGVVVRTLSPAKIGKELKGYTKEAVIGWITVGFGDSKCPATRGKRYGGKEFLLNLDEVKAWRKSVGMDAEKGGEKPLIGEAEKAAETRAEDEKKSERLGAELMEQLVRGDPIASIKMTMVKIFEVVIKVQTREDLGSQTLSQLSTAAKNISAEGRLLLKAEDERDRRRAGVMERSAGTRIIASLAEQIRQSLAALGATIAAEVCRAAAEKSVSVEQEEAFQRVAAAAAQKVLDAELERVADGVARAGEQLAQQGRAETGAAVTGGGLFGGIAA